VEPLPVYTEIMRVVERNIFYACQVATLYLFYNSVIGGHYPAAQSFRHDDEIVFGLDNGILRIGSHRQSSIAG
jgi:hypothetical protein